MAAFYRVLVVLMVLILGSQGENRSWQLHRVVYGMSRRASGDVENSANSIHEIPENFLDWSQSSIVVTQSLVFSTF